MKRCRRAEWGPVHIHRGRRICLLNCVRLSRAARCNTPEDAGVPLRCNTAPNLGFARAGPANASGRRNRLAGRSKSLVIPTQMRGPRLVATTLHQAPPRRRASLPRQSDSRRQIATSPLPAPGRRREGLDFGRDRIDFGMAVSRAIASEPTPASDWEQECLTPLPPEEVERRRRGAVRLAQAFSSSPYYAARANADPDYWTKFCSSHINW